MTQAQARSRFLINLAHVRAAARLLTYFIAFVFLGFYSVVLLH